MMLTALRVPVCGPPLDNMTIDQAPTGTFINAAGQWCIDTGGQPPGAANVPSLGLDQLVDFVTNPLGYLAQQLALCAIWMLGIISKWAVHSTQPDLTVGWWRDAYARSFAVGTVLFGFVLVYQLARSRKGGGHGFMEDVAPWVAGYFFGVFAGPPIAQMMLNGFGALSAGIIEKWGGETPGSGFQGINDALVAIVTQRGSAQAVGAILLSFGLILGAFAVFISLTLQAMIQYLASALFAIGFVWVLSRKHRASAFKIPILFIGICGAQPLMFFMMGIGFQIIKTALFGDAGDIGRFIATVIMAISIFLISAFAPVLLLKFAPVMPTGTSDSTGTSREPHQKQGAQGGAKTGSKGGGSSQTSTTSRRRSSSGGGSSPGGGPAGSSPGGGPSGTRSARTPGPGPGGPGSPGTAPSGGPAGTGSPAGRSGATRAGGRAGGGIPSAAAAKLAAVAPAAAAVAAVVGGASRAVNRGRRKAHNLTKGPNGDQPWS